MRDKIKRDLLCQIMKELFFYIYEKDEFIEIRFNENEYDNFEIKNNDIYSRLKIIFNSDNFAYLYIPFNKSDNIIIEFSNIEKDELKIMNLLKELIEKEYHYKSIEKKKSFNLKIKYMNIKSKYKIYK